MKLHYLSDSLLASLKTDLQKNIARYQDEDSSWLHHYSEGKGLKHPLETAIEVESFPELLKADGTALDDIDATMLLYQWLNSLTPVQARDERLWTWLTHTYGYAYVRARWESVKEKDKKDPAAIVMDRFFLHGRGVGAISRNALSRLWWFGFLTRDQSREDPFRYTRALLSYQNIPVGLFERSLGKNPIIVKQVARYVAENMDKWEDRDNTMKRLITNLNCAGGAVVLDALNAERMIALLDQCVLMQKSPS